MCGWIELSKVLGFKVILGLGLNVVCIWMDFLLVCNRKILFLIDNKILVCIFIIEEWWIFCVGVFVLFKIYIKVNKVWL